MGATVASGKGSGGSLRASTRCSVMVCAAAHRAAAAYAVTGARGELGDWWWGFLCTKRMKKRRLCKEHGAQAGFSSWRGAHGRNAYTKVYGAQLTLYQNVFGFEGVPIMTM